MLVLRSLCFYVGMAISTVTFSLLCPLFIPLRFRLRFYLISRWTVFNLWWLRVCCNVNCHIIGNENIPKQAGIVMCRHQSAWETLFLQTLFVPQTWVMKRELLWIPFFGWGLAALNPITIDRQSPHAALKRIVRGGCDRIKQGRWLVIFPEGTRLALGQSKPWQPGGALVAEKSAADIVPVTHNAGHLWSKNSLVKKPGTITLIIGPPIRSKGKKARQIMQEVTHWMEQANALLPTPKEHG